MGAKRSSRVPRVFKKPSTHREQSGTSSPKSEIQGAICLRDRVTKRSKTPIKQPRAAKENTCEMNRPDDPAQQLPRAALEPHESRHAIKVGRWFEESRALLHQMTPPHAYDCASSARP